MKKTLTTIFVFILFLSSFSEVYAYNLSTANYDSVFLDYSSLTSAEARGFTFNNDGTKLYISDYYNEKIYQYSLSSAFNVGTASYDNVSFTTSDQSSYPFDVEFNNDGTKMYVDGWFEEEIYQYSLSSAFDISTATYDSVSFVTSAQDAAPEDIEFNNDGTKMYILGGSNNRVYQYSLSSAFNVGTASYDNVSFSVNSQDLSSIAIAFSNNGTKMYVLGNSNDRIYQYSLSSAFNVGTASYDNVSFNVSSYGTHLTDIVFNNDGTKMYVSFTTTVSKILQFSIIPDFDSPTISTLTPSDNTTEISTDSNLVIEFSEDVDVESGNITIHKTDDTLVEEIDVTSGQVTGTGTDTITINPTSDFEENTGYYIQIDNTAFDDVAGNSFAGISDETTWNFTTVTPTPEPTSSGSGGLNTEISGSCSVSDTSVKTGEEVDIEIDAEVSKGGDELPYTFRWIKELSGSDKETSISFDTPGEYTIKGKITTAYADKTITCDKITVSEKSSSSDKDTTEDDKDEEKDTTTDTTSIINKYIDIFRKLKEMGIPLPQIEALLSTNTPTPTFTKDLELGDNDPEVKSLQQFLNNKGYTVAPSGPGSKGNETTIFGYATKAALIKFQEANGITPSEGYFGSITRAKINSL